MYLPVSLSGVFTHPSLYVHMFHVRDSVPSFLPSSLPSTLASERESEREGERESVSEAVVFALGYCVAGIFCSVLSQQFR